jgi:hypothetical protein
MAEKAVWDNTNVKHLIDICKEEILAGNRPGGCFSRNGWKNMEDKFLARCGVKLVKTQLKNKLDNLKKDYTQFRSRTMNFTLMQYKYGAYMLVVL